MIIRAPDTFGSWSLALQRTYPAVAASNNSIPFSDRCHTGGAQFHLVFELSLSYPLRVRLLLYGNPIDSREANSNVILRVASLAIQITDHRLDDPLLLGIGSG